MSPKTLAAALVAGLVVTACTGSGSPRDDGLGPERRAVTYRYPSAPEAPPASAPSPAAAVRAIEQIGAGLEGGALDSGAVRVVGESGDPRHAWYIADLMRFFGGARASANAEAAVILEAFEQLTGVSLDDDPASERSVWLSATNHLIAWDTPDYPGYRTDKSVIFLLVEPRWRPFFDDAGSDIDWRHLSWGGVLIDDRELGDPAGCPRGCIPALDDPAVTDAAGGGWYPDEAIVFGLVEAGEALAIPQHIAEIHEMFNLSLGGRRFGIPYCTLCGSAQAYRTDGQAMPVLRTSGLLSRSNKVMYDLRTSSAFDTFTGAAVSGPLKDSGVVLEETTVVRSTWGAWKDAHPETTIIAEDGGIGRSYPLDPLRGRDDSGPIFPIGSADDRVDVHERVLGVARDGRVPVAFRADEARRVLSAGGEVELDGVRLVLVGDGLAAVDADSGERIASHESFWFAWSQFHPATELWDP
jgi:hypothetical protein